MKFELGLIQISDIQFASESKVENETIYVNVEELKALLLEDENLKSAESEIAEPGESVRIMPVEDVTEPRVKVDGDGDLFSGVIPEMETVGGERTNALEGSMVVTTGKIAGFQEGIIDMCGERTRYMPSSQLSNLVVACEPIDGPTKHAHEKAVGFVGFKVADYIDKLAEDVESDEVKVYETCPVKEGIEKYPGLLRVAYVLMLQDQGLMHDTYVYSVDTKRSSPTVLSPTGLMDGTVLSGNRVSACDKNATYHHLNNPVVVDLLEQRGKTLNFVGVIVTDEDVYFTDKMHSSDWTPRLCELLGVDSAIVSQGGFDNPDTSLIMSCKGTGGKGAGIVIITDEYAGRDGASQSLTNVDASANAVVTGRNANIVINLPAMDKVIGHPEVTDIIAGGFDGSLHEDGSIVAKLQVTAGVTNKIGFNELGAR